MEYSHVTVLIVTVAQKTYMTPDHESNVNVSKLHNGTVSIIKMLLSRKPLPTCKVTVKFSIKSTATVQVKSNLFVLLAVLVGITPF